MIPKDAAADASLPKKADITRRTDGITIDGGLSGTARETKGD